MQKKNIIPLISLCISSVIAVFLGIALFFLFKIDNDINRLGSIIKSAQRPGEKPQPKHAEVDADDDPVIGDPNAPVSIIMFSDFECTFCTVFYEKLYGNLSEDFIEPGKINLVIRDYPLSIHPNAMNAAKAAECAEEQGKFEEMFKYLFENPKALSNEEPEKWAEKTGLDAGLFSACMADPATDEEIQKDIKDAQNAGVLGTPAFVINGKLYIGTRPYLEMKDLIEEAIRENKITLSPSDVYERINSTDSDEILIDVRTSEEFSEGRIPGAVNIDVRSDDFADKIAGMGKDNTYIIYCKGNTRSSEALPLMTEAGLINVQRLEGGITEWREQGYKITGEDSF